MILLGHNGAGKSTLINYILGFYTSLHQHPFLIHFSEHISPVITSDVGYAPESAFLDTELSAYDYLKLMATLRGVELGNVKNILAQVALSVDSKVPIKKYSKGMKQRLLLAIALFGNQKTIVLDEPTSGLDPYGREAIESLLISLKDEHDFIISTHSLELAQAMNDDIWIIKEGEIVYKGKPETREALKRLVHNYKPKAIQ